MEKLTRQISTAIDDNDYKTLINIFSRDGSMSWHLIGQGEQRSVAAHFIYHAVNSTSTTTEEKEKSRSSFLPAAFDNAEMVNIMILALGHLPSMVKNAADNKLRELLFDYKVNTEGDYAGAARILGNIRMDDDVNSVYYMNPPEKCDIYVKIAESFLAEDCISESDNAVTKAGSVVELIRDKQNYMTLILRYKATYARVLDYNRKFLSAASRYHDLSLSSSDIIEHHDLLTMLGNATTCAILSKISGTQKQRILGHLYHDPRLEELDLIETFRYHSSILRRMYTNQIILCNDPTLLRFTEALADHQKAIMGDGLTTIQRSITEHNMMAISQLYQSIYFTELAQILSLHEGTNEQRAPAASATQISKAEKIAANMIMDGKIIGYIDQVDGLLLFESNETPQNKYDGTITSFCMNLNTITETIHKNNKQ